MGLNTDHFKRIQFWGCFFFFFLGKQFGGIIKFQKSDLISKRPPRTYLHWSCFLFTPAVHAFPCVPIVRDLFCCLENETLYPSLCLFDVLILLPGQREREREKEETKKKDRDERGEDCQADI